MKMRRARGFNRSDASTGVKTLIHGVADRIKRGPSTSSIKIFLMCIPWLCPCGCSQRIFVSAIPAHVQHRRNIPSALRSPSSVRAQTKIPAPRFRPVAEGKRTTFSAVAVGRPKNFATKAKSTKGSGGGGQSQQRRNHSVEDQ